MAYTNQTLQCIQTYNLFWKGCKVMVQETTFRNQMMIYKDINAKKLMIVRENGI